MRLCKKYAAVIACVLLFCALTLLTAFGHSGRTDSQGGHYDRQNGGYHYHHGYSSHDHPGGVCPFEANVQSAGEDDDFDDPVYDNEEHDDKYRYAYEDNQQVERNRTTSQKQVTKSNRSDNLDVLYSMGIIALLLSPFLIGGVIIHIRLRKRSESIKARSGKQNEHYRLETFALLLPGIAIVAAIILIFVLLYFS